MPVLAREIEAAGIPTVTVTMMPILSQKYRSSRVLGVEFPFGHSFGMPGDTDSQTAVLRAALGLLETATEPETRVDVSMSWPGDPKEWYRRWQPAEPSPIVKATIAELRRSRREAAGEPS